MPKLSTLTAGDQQKLEIPVADGEIVHIVMTPGKLTGDAIIRVTEEENESKAFISVCELLADTIDEWDITDDNDETLPIDVPSIRILPLGFVMMVFNKMQEIANPQTPSGRSFTSG